MTQKNDSSTLAEQSLEHGKRGLTFEDKYVTLQFENQKLKKRIRQIGEAFHDWRERALQYQAERDDCQEKAMKWGFNDL